MAKQSVILARICAIYDNEAFVIQKDSQLKKIFKCADLSGYYTVNSKYLIPYYVNEGYARTFHNTNDEYDVFTGLDNVFSDLLYKGDDKGIGNLLVGLGENIPACRFQEEDDDSVLRRKLEELKNLYELVGYRLIEDADSFYVEPYSGGDDRLNNMSDVERWLEGTFDGVFSAYQGALDSYTSNNYGTCIESCRTVLTGIFSKYKGPEHFAKWFRGAANMSGEMTDAATLKASIDALAKKDLADFFEENRNGSYKKTKAIYAIYSMMSDYGTHREEGTVENPSKADALMMFRMMQDIVLWVYQTKE